MWMSAPLPLHVPQPTKSTPTKRSMLFSTAKRTQCFSIGLLLALLPQHTDSVDFPQSQLGLK
jgi:hypothetical protein